MARSATTLFTILSLLASIAQAGDSSNDPVSFSSFGKIGVNNPPAACSTAFQQSISGCTVSDFVKNNPCSNACILGLVSASNGIKTPCAGVNPSDGPLKAALEGTIVNGLCPNAVVSSQTAAVASVASVNAVSVASIASVTTAAPQRSSSQAPSTSAAPSSSQAPAPSLSGTSEVRISAQAVPTTLVSDTSRPPTTGTIVPSSLVVPSGSIVPLPTANPGGGATPFDSGAERAISGSLGGLAVAAIIAVLIF